MKIHPKDIARSLVESLAASPHADVDDACMSAITLLRRTNPGVHMRDFVKLVERALRKQGTTASAMLVVPHEHSLKSEAIAPLLAAKTGKTVHIDRKTDPELIGGAVLLVEHRRIDCSIKGALESLLRACLQPLD